MRLFALNLLLVAFLAASCQNEPKEGKPAVLTENFVAQVTLSKPQDSSCIEKLCNRAFRKDTAGVRNLLESGCDPNGISLNGDIVLSPLRMASDQVTIKLLLDHGADPNQDMEKNMPPFHYAAYSFTPEILQMMFEKGAKVNKVLIDNSHEFDTPLLCAIRGGNTENVKWLIANGADVNYRTEDLSALTQAVSGGNASIVKMLLEKGVDVNDKFTQDHEDCYYCPIGITTIFFFLYNEKPDKKIIDLLVKHGADINYVCEGGYTVLDMVEDVETANYLLQKGATIETKKTSALAKAAAYYNIDLVKFYLKKGANPNFKKNPPLIAHLHSWSEEYHLHPEKSLEIIQLLLDHGANPAMEVNRYGDTHVSALSFAKSGQRMFITEYFIQKGYIKWRDVKLEGCPEFIKIKCVNAPSGLSVRSAPSLKAPILGKLENGTEIKTCDIPYGDSVEVEGIKGTWNFIKYDGKDGFVFSGFLR